MIAKGDTVRLIDEPGQGNVIEVNGSNALISIDGMEMKYPISELVKVELDQLVKPASNEIVNRADAKLKGIAARNHLRKSPPILESTYELDLHMHQLLDQFEHMSNKQMLDYQLSCAKSFIAEARENHYKNVILIHGVGEGILKAAIRDWLDTQQKVSYQDAPHRTYGYGATEVILWR